MTGEVKTTKHFAWLPLNIDDKLVWLKSYKIDYKVIKEKHYCHDCLNPLTLCSGEEYDTYLSFMRIYIK